MRRFCLSIVVTLAFALTLPAADWARFRGPNGTGVAAGPLPPTDAAALLWKAAIPGRGVSSPIVVGGKVFLQSASDDGVKRSLVCLDAATGKEAWTRELPGKAAKRHAKNSLASGTPACDGERVYAVSWDGAAITLYATGVDGKEAWSQSLGGYVSQHGPGISPVVYGGVVYVNVDDDEGAVLKAFDAKTGVSKWTADRKPHRASYSTPFLLERPGKAAQLILGTTTEVTAYDPATGKVMWAFPLVWAKGQMPLRVVGSPVYAGGLVVCACGDGGGSRYAVGIDPEGKAPHKVWELKKNTPYVPCMLEKDGLLFWIADNGIAACAEAKTGKVLWEERVSVKDVTASPILVGNEILVISEQGQVFVLKAAREYDLIRTGDIGQSVLASAALADGKLYVRGATHLFCYGKK